MLRWSLWPRPQSFTAHARSKKSRANGVVRTAKKPVLTRDSPGPWPLPEASSSVKCKSADCGLTRKKGRYEGSWR